MKAFIAAAALFLLSCSPTSEDKSCCSTLAPGTYRHQESLAGVSATGSAETTTLTGLNALGSDGTFTMDVVQSVPSLGWDQKLVFEEKGKWALAGDSLVLTEVQERAWDQAAGDMGPWAASGNGRIASRIRNVQGDSYEEYEADLNVWVTWQRTK